MFSFLQMYILVFCSVPSAMTSVNVMNLLWIHLAALIL